MNDLPPAAVNPPAPPKAGSKGAIGIGFLLGAAPWLFACLPRTGYDGIPFLIFACFGMPVVAAIVAIIPKTRRVGLGLLLASGLGWLILGAMCSGWFR